MCRRLPNPYNPPMPTWNADQYLRFNDERTRPCRELAARIAVAWPTRIIDLGCGPGNSTAPLKARWPGAQVTGIDSSAELLDAARRGHPGIAFVQSDVAQPFIWNRQRHIESRINPNHRVAITISDA